MQWITWSWCIHTCIHSLCTYIPLYVWWTLCTSHLFPCFWWLYHNRQDYWYLNTHYYTVRILAFRLARYCTVDSSHQTDKCFLLFVALSLQSDNELNTYKAESSQWIKTLYQKRLQIRLRREKNYPGETNKKKAIYWLIEADRLDVRVVYKPDHLSTSLRSTPL